MTIYKFGSAHNLLPWPALPYPSLTCANPTKRKHAQPRALSWFANVGPTNWKTSKEWMSSSNTSSMNEFNIEPYPFGFKMYLQSIHFWKTDSSTKNSHVSVPCSSSESSGAFHQPIMPFGLVIINHPMLWLESWLLQFLLNIVYKKHLLVSKIFCLGLRSSP